MDELLVNAGERRLARRRMRGPGRNDGRHQDELATDRANASPAPHDRQPQDELDPPFEIIEPAALARAGRCSTRRTRAASIRATFLHSSRLDLADPAPLGGQLRRRADRRRGRRAAIR